MDNIDEQYIETLKENLKHKPLNEWSAFSSVIGSYNIFEDSALRIVQDALSLILETKQILLDKPNKELINEVDKSF